jgi:hypothetical protein
VSDAQLELNLCCPVFVAARLQNAPHSWVDKLPGEICYELAEMILG